MSYDAEWEAELGRYSRSNLEALWREAGLPAASPELMTLGVNSSTLQFRARELDGESVVEMGSGQSWVMIAKFPGAFGGLRADSYVKFMETNGRR